MSSHSLRPELLNLLSRLSTSLTEPFVNGVLTSLGSNNGTFPESNQGRYQHSGVLWANEELCEKAMEYVRANSAVKGTPNMNKMDFYKWVNKTLFHNSTLEPGFPCKVSVETAQKWGYEMGFEVLHARKGIFIDGHERPDIVASRV